MNHHLLRNGVVVGCWGFPRGFKCVNLIVSENVMSPLAKSLYLSDMMRRYAEGRSGKRFY